MSDLGRLADDDVVALVPEWTGMPGRPRVRARAVTGAGDAALVVQSATSVSDVVDLCFLVEGIGEDGTRAIDAGGFTASGDDVVVWNVVDDRVTVSRWAFADLLGRLVDVALAHADDIDDADALARLREVAGNRA